jgi:flagellar basal-body rod modification protein FlgD
MDVRQTNSITGVGSPAAATVATSLVPRPAATSKTTGAAKPMAAASTANTTSAAANSSTITSSDFLTLLVSELQNQDPTQPTDPNAYITQLVGVNSLQQLIQINSGLTSIEKPPTTSPTTSTSPTASAVSGTNSGASANAVAATNSVSGTQWAANPNSIWGGATSS